jgi:hypothetical protein
MTKPVEITGIDLCRLLGVSLQALSDPAKREIVVLGERRERYRLEAKTSAVPILRLIPSMIGSYQDAGNLADSQIQRRVAASG